MKFIDVDYDIPFYNFALEEYLLTHAPQDHYLFFYVHRPSVIIGVHQIAEEEVHKAYVDQNEIIVARRMSGGGAVYHDNGNLNFSFVQPGKPTAVNDFAVFTRPIVEVLRTLGTDARLSGRNDLLIGDRKVSGNAACYRNGRIMSHGTLLFQSNMDALSCALKVKDIKIKSKGVASVKSRVGNIADYLSDDLGVTDLKEAILDYFVQKEGVAPFTLDEAALSAIHSRAETHFASWAWNWGASPPYTLQRIAKFPCGIIDVRFSIKNGIIQDCHIFGDFFTWRSIAELEGVFIGRPFTWEAMQSTLADVPLDAFFNGLDPEAFASFLWQGAQVAHESEALQ